MNGAVPEVNVLPLSPASQSRVLLYEANQVLRASVQARNLWLERFYY